MTGTLYPPHCVRPTKSEAEKRVHALLQRHLPDGWTAWHSFRFTAHGGPSPMREIDFLLWVPDGGVIVVEVKGGAGWSIRGGRLFRSEHEEASEDPMTQAVTARNALVEALRQRLQSTKTPWFETLVMFPDVEGYEGPSGYGYEGATLTGARLSYLEDELRAFAQRRFAGKYPGHRRSYEALHALWCESWVPALRVRDMRTQRDHELFVLTAAQRGLAQRLALRGSLLVTGGPGSGKSVVAREAAFRWAEHGKTVTFFCYTLGLARELREAGLHEAHAIREYMRARVSAADPSFDASDATPWDEARWADLVQRALRLDVPVEERPDVLVVDEAQDLNPDDWAFLDRLRREDTALLALGDDGQRFLATAGIAHERFDVELGLEEQLRSPQPVVALAQAVLAGEPLDLEPSEHVRVERVRPDETRWDAIVRAVDALRAERFEARDVCILSLASVGKMTRRPSEHASVLVTVPADSPEASERVVMDTALRFKGLERPWVVITDVEQPLSEAARLRLYIALTRCTVGVTVVLGA